MTVYISADARNPREEIASLRNQGGYETRKFYLSPNLVTNGTFDEDIAWTKSGVAWTISGGLATRTAPNPTDWMDQDIGHTVGTKYGLTITISGATSGNYLISLGGNTFLSGSANGTFTVYYTPSGTNPLRILGDVNFNGSVDNIAVFEVDASNNPTYTYRLPLGWKPKNVFDDGLLLREGAAHDYEVSFDGFYYYINHTVAPSATTETCVIGVRA